MKVLVIGGTRYMGRIAVQRMLERGDRVTIFSRGNTRPEWWDQVEHIPGDRKDPTDFAAKLKAYFMNPEATRSPEYEKGVQEWEQGLARLVTGIDRSASPEQRGRVVQRLARYAEDFRVLAGVGGGGGPVATSRGPGAVTAQ